MEGVQCCSTRTLTFLTSKVKSIYLHDIRRVLPDKVVEGEVRLGITRRAITCLFSSTTSQRSRTFTVMSLHMSNVNAKKRGIGKKLLLTIRAVMLEEHVDSVAGDFNGAAWRRATAAPVVSVSSKKPSPTVTCRCLQAPHCCGVQGRCQVRGQTCVWISQAPGL